MGGIVLITTGSVVSVVVSVYVARPSKDAPFTPTIEPFGRVTL